MRQIARHGQDRRYHHVRVGINSRLDTLQAAILLAKLEIFPEEVAARARIGARYTELLEEQLLVNGGKYLDSNHQPSTINHQLYLSCQPLAPNQKPSTINHQLTLPYIEPHNTSVYAQYTIRVNNREQVQKKLKEAGIPTAVHYPIPLNKQPAVADGHVVLPVGDEVAGQVVSLPMHPYLKDGDLIEICANLKDMMVSV